MEEESEEEEEEEEEGDSAKRRGSDDGMSFIGSEFGVCDSLTVVQSEKATSSLLGASSRAGALFCKDSNASRSRVQPLLFSELEFDCCGPLLD